MMPMMQPQPQPAPDASAAIDKLTGIVDRAQSMMSVAMTQNMQAIGFIGQQVSKVEEKIDGAKPESVEKVRDASGKMVGARIKQADGTVREVTIQ